MGYVVLGLGVWSVAFPGYNSDYWNMGVKGAMFQMIAHGISSAGMFFLVGVVYDRVHHRNLNEFGGLFGKMPVYTALSIGIFFAALGLPGLCGFIGEVFVVLSVWNFDKILAVIAASVVILTASYILWAIQRVYLGPEYRGPHPEALQPSNAPGEFDRRRVVRLCHPAGRVSPDFCAALHWTARLIGRWRPWRSGPSVWHLRRWCRHPDRRFPMTREYRP